MKLLFAAILLASADSRSFVVNRYADLYYIRHVRAHCMLRAHEAGACPGGKK
jgi:hypothetical protein